MKIYFVINECFNLLGKKTQDVILKEFFYFVYALLLASPSKQQIRVASERNLIET